MKCIWLLLFVFCAQGASASYVDNDLLQIFRNVRDIGPISVSDSCQEALALYVENIQSATDDRWALQMFDATSKIPVGLLSYNFGELGQFSQCLKTESADGLIKAKYCLGVLPPDLLDIAAANLTKQAHLIRKAARGLINVRDTEEDNSSSDVGITWALCLPSSCSNEDVGEIFNTIFGSKQVDCQTKEDLNPPLTAGAIVAIVLLANLVLIMVCSTALDVYHKYTNTKPRHLMLTAFSVYTNGHRLFKVNKNSNELTCLNGLRLYSMVWVIIGHVYSVSSALPVTNYKDLIEWLETSRSMLVYSGTLSVDTFLLLSGLLIVYGYIKAKHNGTKFNIFQFYIHRYLRLTPALAAAALVIATLLRYMGTGPKWQSIHLAEKGCQKYWWATLLYVQNYVDHEGNFCVDQSWYLSVDMQLYIISPLLLIPLWKYPKIGLGLTSAGILTFIIVPFCIAYVEELPSFITATNVDPDRALAFTTDYYIKTHTRAAPWFMGVLLGYILAKIKFEGKLRHVTVNKVIIIVAWAVCFAVGLGCIYGGHNTLRVNEQNVWANSFYIALVRPAWVLSVSWVIFACVIGYGGPINWLLSLPIYQVLNRFTYSIYILHYQVLWVLGYRMKIGLYFDEVSWCYAFWGATMFSFGLSVIWVLAFESPITVIEKLIFSSPKKTNNIEEHRDKDVLPA